MSTNAGTAFKKYLVVILAIFALVSSETASAHNVNSYSGTCASGPQYKVTASVSNVNNSSNYRWQWKNGSTWVCFVNGNNTINGNTYNVTGSVYNLTTNPGPIIFTNPNSGLQGLEIRMVISDGNGVNPCNMPNGNTWTSTTNHFINVNGTSCGSCTGRVTSLYFNKLDGGTDLPIANGATFTTAQLGSLYNLEVATTGTVGSVKFTITGPTASTVIENSAPYNSPASGSGAWTGAAGNYSVNIKVYSGSGATGTICHEMTITFTLVNLGSIGDRVWYDTDRDGIQDAGENGIRGVTVKLRNSANTVIATTTTNTSGNYLFPNLAAGTYKVEFPVTVYGYILSPAYVGSNRDVDSDPAIATGITPNITLAAGQDITNIDAGFAPDCSCVNSAANLLTNPSFESGTTGWSWSSSNGSLTTGNSYVACGAKNGFNDWSSGTARVWQDVNVSAGAVVNFSAYAGTHAPGLSCSPKLSLIFLNSSGGVISQSDVAVTRVVGDYNDQLEQYSISNVTAPANTVKVRVQSSITCNYMKLDAFCLTATVPAVLNLGNFVWYDADNDGIQDANEPGISGATVKLYADANMDNVPDGAALATTTTNASGAYGFGSLTAGNYIVGVTLPAGYTGGTTTATSASPNNDNNTDNNGVTIVSGELRSNYITLSVGGEPTTDGDGSNGNLTLDFGLKGTASIGDYVWEDLDRDGIQQPNEPAIAGVTVTLTTPTGTVVTTTNANGLYNFPNLAPGTYTVAFSTPATYFATQAKAGAGANDATDSDPVNGVVSNISLAAGQVKNTIDAGFYRLINISGNVWNDANGLTDLQINKTGTQALPNSLFIYLVDVATNLVVQAETINPDGTYAFLDVEVNHSYKIVLTTVFTFPGQPSPVPFLPSGWQRVGENLGAGPFSGSDGVPNGLLFVDTETSDVINANFGIRVRSGEVIIG